MRIIFHLAAFVLIAKLSAMSAVAGFGQSKDWPCIQREVPKISAGMVWSGAPIDAESREWTQMPEVAEVAVRITSRRLSVSEVLAEIDHFAGGLAEKRALKLRALFTGALQRTNAERRKIIAGIKRYARRQAALAKQIKDKSAQETMLLRLTKRTQDQGRVLAGLVEQITWDMRIYEEREASLKYVCETAVLLERRLFQIGRHISRQVKQR